MMRKILVLGLLGLMLSLSPAYALIPNGDFETGDLSGYTIHEGFIEVPSSPLVKNIDDGSGNHVAELNSGFLSHGVILSFLDRDFGVLPADVQDLVFDVKFFDLGNGSTEFDLLNSFQVAPLQSFNPDYMFVNLSVDYPTVSLFYLDANLVRNDNPVGTTYELLPNGFYRVKTDMTPFAAGGNVKVHFALADRVNTYQSKVWVDNIDLTTANQAVAPEPASMLLIGGGLMGFGYLRKKKLV